MNINNYEQAFYITGNQKNKLVNLQAPEDTSWL